MPNLKQLINLKEKYGDGNSKFKRSDVKLLLESFDTSRIGAAIRNLKTKSFSFPEFRMEDYVNYFLERTKANVVLLFVDITSFSTKFNDKTTDELVEYLDDYYLTVIPIINQHGGEVEKIMGDGIICVFGEPFLDEGVRQLHNRADKCARNLIAILKDTDYEIKVALHAGEVMYYKNPCEEYYEFTMIGNAITELFRLESISIGNSINYFGSTFYDHLIESSAVNFDSSFARLAGLKLPDWRIQHSISADLQGVEYANMKSIRYFGG